MSIQSLREVQRYQDTGFDLYDVVLFCDIAGKDSLLQGASAYASLTQSKDGMRLPLANSNREAYADYVYVMRNISSQAITVPAALC